MTYEKLENKVSAIETRLNRVTATNSELRDELVELKQHYSNLVEGLNGRFQIFEESLKKSFRKT
tara:strand:+ start:456 stop:647 length:192 start_codon:yes stop_codon:yes gene_type:complete